jgi:hypothetical protein
VVLMSLATNPRHLASRMARALPLESLAISERINSRYQIGMTEIFLGRLEEQQGHTDEAIALYRAVRSLAHLQIPIAAEAREVPRALGVEP